MDCAAAENCIYRHLLGSIHGLSASTSATAKSQPRSGSRGSARVRPGPGLLPSRVLCTGCKHRLGCVGPSYAQPMSLSRALRPSTLAHQPWDREPADRFVHLPLSVPWWRVVAAPTDFEGGRDSVDMARATSSAPSPSPYHPWTVPRMDQANVAR
ncbi:hypothetical protein P171DRAFT_440674 [Karstenula rhodostoma CBS 690.94]|uniref:Uncharacterized protein n=1 Tax=Karstenula rhodostoma CBS 690.94 TaxID=1392251 RepID=A0A9P4PPZ8_9PLEO|nr:hypothetical protein P171DRAFT_440674 [Karstenula rhodostoma CBS 690.94]